MGSIVSARAIFLIVAIGLHLHIPVPELILLIVGYTLCDNVDQWLERRARREKIQQVIDHEAEWEKDPSVPQWETQEGFTRIKLPQNEQIVVTRIAEILRRIHGSW
jgi:hypothetical protein